MQPLPWDVPNKNVDEVSLTTNLRLISNGYMDEAKAIHKRPGLKVFADLNSGRGTDGKYSWNAKAMEICVSNSNVYKIDSDTGTVTQIATGIMQLDYRVSFVEIYDVTSKELRLFMANGGQVYWTNGTTGAYCTGALAPTICFGITAIDTYLLCMDAQNPYGFNWSVVGDPTNINGGSASSQLFDDEVLSLGVNNDKVYVFSSSYIEVYYSTGDAVPFSPVPGGVINYGIASRDATAYLADIIFTLNPERDVLSINNFSMTILSFNYAKYIQSLSVVNDVEFDLVKGYGGRKWLVMTFKDANLTLVYDLVTKAFYEWGTWNGVSNDKLDVRCYSYNNIWDKHLIGSRTTSIIYEMDVNTFNDNGQPIHTEVITGNYQQAGFDYINSEMTMVDTKRGVGSLEVEPAFTWQYRDNRENTWSNQVEIPLGLSGDCKLADPLRNTGRYRSRQHRIIHQDDSEFVLNKIYEKVSHE